MSEKLVLEIEGKKFQLPLMEGLTIDDPTNPECLKKGNLCAHYRGEHCCIHLEMKEEKGEGFEGVNLYEIRKCSKNPSWRGIEINE
jgi:hypothetical protein